MSTSAPLRPNATQQTGLWLGVISIIKTEVTPAATSAAENGATFREHIMHVTVCQAALGLMGHQLLGDYLLQTDLQNLSF